PPPPARFYTLSLHDALPIFDHLHAGTAVGKLEGDPLTVQGYYNVCRESINEVDLPRGLFYRQEWGGVRKVMPVASGGIHAGQMQDRKSTRLNSSHVAISYAV